MSSYRCLSFFAVLLTFFVLVLFPIAACAELPTVSDDDVVAAISANDTADSTDLAPIADAVLAQSHWGTGLSLLGWLEDGRLHISALLPAPATSPRSPPAQT